MRRGGDWVFSPHSGFPLPPGQRPLARLPSLPFPALHTALQELSLPGCLHRGARRTWQAEATGRGSAGSGRALGDSYL